MPEAYSHPFDWWVVIFITAVVFLAWFFIGGYAAPGA
ncbi:YoaK family small membrane protein [Escherichia coli]|nr:YoaK family small membrane protein [Escherichia coli]